MKLGSGALVLLVVLLAVAFAAGSTSVDGPLVPTMKEYWVAFSHDEATEGYAQVSFDQESRTIAPPLPREDAILQDDEVTVELESHTVHVYLNGDPVWSSDPSWEIRQIMVADLNNDDQEEAALTLWKPFQLEPYVVYGTFGFPSPWDEGSWRNHLFLYGWRDGKWRPLWCSSPLPDPIEEMAVGDVDGDEAQELVVLEGSYDNSLDSPARHASVWRWNGWGFTLQWRSSPGEYEKLILQDVTGDAILDIVLTDV